MLIACSSCHRQYDAVDLQVGSKVRCLCGELQEIARVEPREMQMLRCSSCGGQLETGAKECGFCGSTASLADRGFGGPCPECYARMPKDARFCCTCGVAIRPAGRMQPLHDKPCPRCEAGTLAIQEFDSGSIVECTGCGGVWLEESVFETMTKEREKHVVSKFVTGRAGRGSSDPDEGTPGYDANVRYLKCPTCSQLMHRKNFASASGVIIDWCNGHGFWFDRNELERIIKFISEGGLDVARDREYSRREAHLRRERARIETQKSQDTGEFGQVGGAHCYGGLHLLDGILSAIHRLF